MLSWGRLSLQTVSHPSLDFLYAVLLCVLLKLSLRQLGVSVRGVFGLAEMPNKSSVGTEVRKPRRRSMANGPRTMVLMAPFGIEYLESQ